MLNSQRVSSPIPMRIISGRQNPAIRVFRSLASDSDSRGERLLLDGAHLVREALDAGTVVRDRGGRLIASDT